MKTKTNLYFIVIIISLIVIIPGCEKGDENSPHLQLTDTRDGKTYQTIEMGAQIWMAENLNYDAGNGSWFYDDSATNAVTFGRLYDWETACDVCPDGWHLPSDGEWKELEIYLGMSQSQADYTGWRGTDIGNKLKSTSGWNSGGNGTNESGFSAFPAGNRTSNGRFLNIGFYAFFWSSVKYDDSYAWSRRLSAPSEDVVRYYYNKDLGFSVRCVMD